VSPFYGLELILVVAVAVVAALLLVIDQQTAVTALKRMYCSYYGHRWQIASGSYDACTRCGEQKNVQERR
jgi:hypothetical protein